MNCYPSVSALVSRECGGAMCGGPAGPHVHHGKLERLAGKAIAAVSPVSLSTRTPTREHEPRNPLLNRLLNTNAPVPKSLSTPDATSPSSTSPVSVSSSALLYGLEESHRGPLIRVQSTKYSVLYLSPAGTPRARGLGHRIPLLTFLVQVTRSRSRSSRDRLRLRALSSCVALGGRRAHSIAGTFGGPELPAERPVRLSSAPVGPLAGVSRLAHASPSSGAQPQ